MPGKILMFQLPFKDTQYGAKVLRKQVIDNIKHELKTNYFDFDVELLHRIQKAGYKVRESAIYWSNKENSTFNFLSDTLKMIFNNIRLRVSNN